MCEENVCVCERARMNGVLHSPMYYIKALSHIFFRFHK